MRRRCSWQYIHACVRVVGNEGSPAIVRAQQINPSARVLLSTGTQIGSLAMS